MTYPILEFDEARESLIEPSFFHRPIAGAEFCVLTFFREVIERVREEQKAVPIAVLRSEMGEHPVYEMDFRGRKVAFYHAGVGAPLAAGLLEEVIAHGFRKFVACGSAGVLDRDLHVGKIIIPSSALRDEGLSYHYLPAGREIALSPANVLHLELHLRNQGIDPLVGKTWTTDGFYRETRSKIEKRKAEGCVTVEMECAALAAVCHFRKVEFAQYLYAGDDISGDLWDHRSWHNCEVREKLFWASVEACLAL